MKTLSSGSLLTRATILAGAAVMLALPAQVIACGGFFAAAGRIITQPGETVFLDYDSATKTESFVVQAKFTGDAADFGMLLPVPSKPTLNEMPKEFFSELSVFTQLEPLNRNKYLAGAPRGGFGGGAAGGTGGGRGGAGGAAPATTVEVLETGVVGTLEYKTIAAEKPDDLYQWLKDNNYSYSGDEDTLKYYIDKKWVFVAMKIDSKQVTAGPDGKFSGQITPTRFTFASDKAVYPMHMSQMSTDMTRENGMDKTDVLFYIQSDHKMDLGGNFSYEYTFVPMWTASFAQERGSMVTDEEFSWNKVATPISSKYNTTAVNIRNGKHSPAVLMFAKKMTAPDTAMLNGSAPFDMNRRATPDQVEKLKQLDGTLQTGKYLTKIRKIFSEDELNDDLVFVPAAVSNTPDDMEYYETLPTTAATQQEFTVAAPPTMSAIQRNVQTAISNLNGAAVAGRGGFVEKARADLEVLNKDLGDGLT
ncbi:MAG TPA: DUF2330 domain-containing protein, partial [Opitutales bacterium]|nr:DUF2330 domain-containing protein [Opitutales bacterium]